MLDLFHRNTYVDNPYVNFYEISTKDNNNQKFQIASKFKSKPILVVNVSPNSIENNKEKIEFLKKVSSEKNIDVLVYPTNSLDKSEYTTEEINNKFKCFEDNKVNVLGKVSIKGTDICEVYKFLLRNSPLFIYKQGTAKAITSDFNVFLIDKKGQVKSYFSSISNKSEIENTVDLIQSEEIKERDLELKIRNDFIKLGKFI